ncbi:unnamed protein product [Paramecium primaurelia]|uniref:Tetratricopeptide repeat protein n=1 Tax=Paramecium primaurelia TaxID=5886 RepID=A0A8S1QM22_PARPR|nr:unnamed protein product [Paramecium primaurelia]
MEQDNTILDQMKQQLQTKDYLTFKSQINIIKRYYSKEKENQIQKQIIQLNNILETLKNMVIELTKNGDYIINADQNQINIQQIIGESEDKKQQNIKEAERLLKEGVALYNLNKYQDAIECYDKATSINPKYDIAWNNKGDALNNLNKYQDAIECLDKAISINPKFDIAWSNKGYALHNLQKYTDAISCYDQALSININPLRLQRKADSLFELGKKSEAKQFYLAYIAKRIQQYDLYLEITIKVMKQYHIKKKQYNKIKHFILINSSLFLLQEFSKQFIIFWPLFLLNINQINIAIVLIPELKTHLNSFLFISGYDVTSKRIRFHSKILNPFQKKIRLYRMLSQKEVNSNFKDIKFQGLKCQSHQILFRTRNQSYFYSHQSFALIILNFRQNDHTSQQRNDISEMSLFQSAKDYENSQKINSQLILNRNVVGCLKGIKNLNQIYDRACQIDIKKFLIS